MRTAEMLRDTRPIYHLAVLISLSVGYVQPLPLQVLPNIPGFIPVYIRYGDQPLEEINPALAEAFHERSSLSKSINLDSPVPEDLNLEKEDESKYKIEAVRVRQVNNNFSGESEESKKPAEKTVKTAEIVVDNSKGNQHEKSRRKVPPKGVVKLLPLTEEEKKALELSQIEEAKSRNNIEDKYKILSNIEEESKSLKEKSNQYLPKSSNDEPRDKNSKKTSDLVEKVESIITEELTPPKLRQAEVENAPAAPVTSDESPIKKQPLPHVLSNVHKLSPSPEILLELEKEQAENQSLEEKSK